MKKNKKFLLGVGISNLKKKEILEEIKRWLGKKSGLNQLVTVNPEIVVLANKNERFKKLLNNAPIATADGLGILLAGKILGTPFKEKVTGVDLVVELVKMANDLGLTVGLIGGRGDLAVKTAECLRKRHPNLKIFGLEGIKNIKNPSFKEWERIISITADHKPQMLFVAFGAPYQEFFIESLKKNLQPNFRPAKQAGRKLATKSRPTYNLQPIVAIGVGGAFEEISGRVKQVPKWLDNLGFKWLWRLICQPWRWRRQLALLEFIWLVLKKKLNLQRGDIIRSK